MAGEFEDWDSDYERQLEEDYAYEANPYGTGGDPDDNRSWDDRADASDELFDDDQLTDIDFQPGNDYADDGTDEYANQFGDKANDGDGQSEDGNEGENGKQDNQENNADVNTQQNANNAQKQAAQKQAAQKQAAAQKDSGFDDPNAKIKWKPKDPITVSLLSEIWQKCRSISKVKPMIEQANNLVKAALNSTGGPNLMVKFNEYTDKLMDDPNMDTIGSLLKLAVSNGKRIALTVASTVMSIFTQQWGEVVLLATLTPAVVNSIFAMTTPVPVFPILTAILTIAVPIINMMAKKGNK